MKMLRQTPEQLVLLHRPVLLCAALSVGALVMIGLTLWNATQAEWVKAGVGLLSTFALIAPALWFAAERVDVTFDAMTQKVTIKTRRLSGAQEEAYALSKVARAMVQTHKGSGDSMGAHRVALVLEPGRIEDRVPLTTGYAGGRGAAALVTRINGWLEDTRKT